MKAIISMAFLLLATSLKGQINAYTLEEALTNPKETESLFLSGVQHFPDEILELANLRVLVIENSKIEFPSDISKLNHLERLEIADCMHFPKGIYNIVNLKYLALSGVKFNSIDLKEASKISVKKLLLSNLYQKNKVPKNWNAIQFDSLEIAFFNDLNQFVEIKSCINLRYLNIFYCAGRTIPKFMFQPINLETLTIKSMVVESVLIPETTTLQSIRLIDCAVECQLILDELSPFQTIIEKPVGLDENCKMKLKSRENILIESP